MLIKHFNSEEDLKQSIALRKYVFHSTFTEQKSKDYQSLLGMADKIGAFSQENLVGQILNLPIFVNFYGDVVPAVGINHVGVYPENRGQGVATKLMLDSLKTAKTNRQILAILQPFAPSFYRKFGFDLYTERLNYVVNEEKYPRFERDTAISIIRKVPEDIDQNDWEFIEKIYDKVAKATHGMQIRDDIWWERHRKQYPNLNYCLAFENGKCAGFVSYWKDGTTLKIIDFIYSSNKVRKQLWWFLESHKANIFTIEGVSTLSRNLSYDFYDPRIEQNIWLDTMIRIVDIESFLNLVLKRANLQSSIRFSVRDDSAKWNSGSYLLNRNGVKFDSGILSSQVITPNQLATIFLGPLNKEQLIQYLEPVKESPMKALIDLVAEKKESHFLGEF